MRRLLTFLLAAMACAACTQNEVEELSANREALPETLTVGFEGGDTRVELNEALKTVWTEGDEVSVYFYSDANQKWQYQGETGERLGTLRRVDAGVATTQADYVVVAYPYNTSYTLNRINANLIASLPAVQSYKEGSYGAEGNIMVAQSEFTQFSLKSVCGWLRVELTGKRHIVNSITLRGNAGEQVAGLIYVDTATAEAILASEMGEASDEEQVGGIGGGLEFDDTVFTEVTLDCGDGVELGAEATAFYVALLPQTFEKGMTIDINYANAEPQTLVCENSITISRNHISPIGIEANEEAEVPTNQLWYTATALVEPDDTSAFNVAIVSNEWDETTGEGVITFDGELTEIGWDAFYKCTNLTSVTIPDSVTTIGNYAFSKCSSLTSVTIGDSVTTIGYGVFADCSNLAEFKGKFAADGGRCLIIDGVLNAFALGCGVTEYTIPDSVTTIGKHAFSYCRSLTSVTIPDSVTTIEYAAFMGCSNLTSVTIPDSVTTIGDQAFCYCSSLTSVTIGDNVTTIGNNAFYLCDNLTSVTIPDSVTTIGYAAFAVCSSLAEFKGKFAADGGRCLIIDGVLNAFALGCGVTEYTIPDSVTTIGVWAFLYCDSLTSVTIPDSVTTIGGSAFRYCSSLTSVYCKATAPPHIDGAVFNNNSTDRKIYVYEECVDAYKTAWSEFADSIVAGGNIPESVTTTILYTTSDGAVIDASKFPVKSHTYNNGVGELILYGELKAIPDKAFYEFGTLTTITIPDSVTTIGEEAFYSCDSLTSITIPDSVTTIGDRVFDSCSSLTSVTIGNSVTTIGEDAFYWCSSLTSVTIPDSVTTIGERAFDSCSSLTSITIGDSVTMIGERAFYWCRSLTSVTIPDSVTSIGNSAFEYCSSLTSVAIPDSVTTIGDEVFAGCSNIAEFKGKFAADGGRCLIKDNTLIAYANASGTTYTIPDSVTTIGDSAFYNCRSLTSVTISDSVTTIGDSAFSGCYYLRSVTIPDSVTTIGDYAFYNCDSLTSVTIPDSVTTIGDEAFWNCDSLTSVYCKATTPPSLGYDAFKYYDNGYVVKICCAIYVPAESVEEYKAATNWSEYAADIVGYNFETGEEVAISNKLFYTATALVEPDDTSAFNVAIVSNEWDETTGEGVITFDGELTTIGEEAFDCCSSLTSVTIPDSVTTIGNWAFDDCNSLTSVTIPDSVTTIGYAAFYACTSLTSVYCEATTPPTLGYYVFKYYDNGYVNLGCAIYVPAESVEEYKAATNWSEYAAKIVGYNFE